jgi:hypothetical protein
MKKYHIIYLIGIVFLTGACAEEDSIGMPDYEVGVIANADIAENKYFFNADNLQGTEIEFDLNYNGFDVHEAQSIELYISNGPETVTVGTFNSFPSTITMTAEEAYSYFGETLNDFDDDGSGRDEFQFTYTLTTTDGTEYSQFGQYYTYNPSLDGRFTGRFAQFYTNLPGFGVLIFDVRPPNPNHPNEN